MSKEKNVNETMLCNYIQIVSNIAPSRPRQGASRATPVACVNQGEITFENCTNKQKLWQYASNVEINIVSRK